MATPIAPTPTVYGQDAVELLESLERCCSPEELERRAQAAMDRLSTSFYSLARFLKCD